MFYFNRFWETIGEMFTLEEMVTLDSEGTDTKQMEEYFEVGVSSKTPYSDITKVSD